MAIAPQAMPARIALAPFQNCDASKVIPLVMLSIGTKVEGGRGKQERMAPGQGDQKSERHENESEREAETGESRRLRKDSEHQRRPRRRR